MKQLLLIIALSISTVGITSEEYPDGSVKFEKNELLSLQQLVSELRHDNTALSDELKAVTKRYKICKSKNRT